MRTETTLYLYFKKPPPICSPVVWFSPRMITWNPRENKTFQSAIAEEWRGPTTIQLFAHT